MTVRKFLDLSTAHLSAEARRALAEERCICVDPHGGAEGVYGWWLWAGADRGSLAADGVPADLVAIMDFAAARGCDWICFDRNGAEIDELPAFERSDGSIGDAAIIRG